MGVCWNTRSFAMPRSWTFLLCCAASMLLGVGALPAEAGRLSETLLPDTTQGFFAISNVDVLNEHWDKTQLGHLMADPAMKPFTKDIRRQFDNRWSRIHERLGLSFDDLRKVPGGDVAIAVIAPAPGKAALAIVADVTGKLPQAKEMLATTTKTQLQRGAKRSEVTVTGCPDVIIQFDLPELEEEKEAARSTLDGSGNDKSDTAPLTEKPPQRRAFYCLTGNLLAVTDDLAVMKGILDRFCGNRQNGSLAEHKAFRAVIDRCKKDYGTAAPQMRWFLHPVGYAEAIRASTPSYKLRKGKSLLEVMRRQGLGAVQGIGGLVDFSSEGYELIHRTAIFAPPPYEKSMKMAVLPNSADFTPQSWVPRDISTYTSVYVNMLNAFDNFGPLFDEFAGGGEEGVWIKDVLPGLEQSPNGPHINLRQEIIAHLTNRISILTDCQLPITTSSERLLIAVETKNEKAVLKGIEKFFMGDKTVVRREINGHIVWELVGDQSPSPEPPKLDFSGVPPVGPAHPRKKKSEDDDDEEEDVQPHLLPHRAVTIANGQLMIASHFDLLKKVIAPAKKPELLVDDAAYKLVDEEIKKLDPKRCFRFFSRTDEEYRPTYELIRMNKLPESESLFAKLLNALAGEEKKGATRKQRIDGRELPDYQMVRRYLGPAGLQITSEPEGWFLKGFTLTK
jgi:hypothetical protein